MLGARGVALGLGKINLNDLNSLPLAQRQAALAAQKRMEAVKAEQRPRVIIKKHVDRQTLWAACRAVIFGSVLIALGIIMTVLGYFATELATSTFHNVTTNHTVMSIDDTMRTQYDAMRFIGPVLMGVGTFILMIACVMTLESRDKHAQIIHEIPPDSLSRAQSRRSRRPVVSSEEQKPLAEPKDEQSNDVSSKQFLKPNNNNNDKLFINSEPALLEMEMGRRGSRPSLRSDNNRDMAVPPCFYYAGPEMAGVVNRCYLRTDSDSVPYSTTTTTLSKSMRDSDLNKFPSTSCIDTLIKSADTRVLLQRFLEDQSRLVADLSERSHDTRMLKKQSNSLEVHGSERTPLPQRTALSEGMPARHSIIAEVHQSEERSPEQNAVPSLLLPGAETEAPDSESEEFCSPTSPPSASMVSADACFSDSSSNSQSLDNSDASFVTLVDDENANIPIDSTSTAVQPDSTKSLMDKLNANSQTPTGIGS